MGGPCGALGTRQNEEVSQALLDEFNLMPLYRKFDKLSFGFYFNGKIHPIDMGGNVILAAAVGSPEHLHRHHSG